MKDFLYALACALLIAYAYMSDQEPGCTTDAQCAEFCPPPADDPDCDGGPQPTMYRVRYPEIIGVRG